jgi:hypothetical protein
VYRAEIQFLQRETNVCTEDRRRRGIRHLFGALEGAGGKLKTKGREVRVDEPLILLPDPRDGHKDDEEPELPGEPPIILDCLVGTRHEG